MISLFNYKWRNFLCKNQNLFCINFTIFCKRMNCELKPPSSVIHMTELDKESFAKTFSIPSIIINRSNLNNVMKKSKKYLLKKKNFLSVINLDSDESKRILLNPEIIKSQDDVHDVMNIESNEITKFHYTDVTLKYDNWSSEEVLKAILPQDSEGCSGYSIIGHILHLNLRDHLHPYKKLIGQVFLDKIPQVTMIINKTDIIDKSDNTYRSFSWEKLAGDIDDPLVTVKENHCTFKFDFSKVYWNPRLSTEHERLVKLIKLGDVLFDVMTGVGPFAIPTARKGCQAFANDLNPHSFEALKDNCKLNKVSHKVQCYNLDGHEFIRTILKEKMISIFNEEFNDSVHIAMNLPSIAINFLSSFMDLYTPQEYPKIKDDKPFNKLPRVHVYLFSFSEIKEFAVYLVASKLGYTYEELNETDKELDIENIKKNVKNTFWNHVIEVNNVRRVAPAKIMFRVSFYMPLEVLLKSEDNPCKKIKL